MIEQLAIYQQEFLATFNFNLQDCISTDGRFAMSKFCFAVKVPFGGSCKEYVAKNYGQKALALIEKIIEITR
jgi:hypothetical protein